MMKFNLAIATLILAGCAAPKNEKATESSDDTLAQVAPVEESASVEESESMEDTSVEDRACACSGRAYLIDPDTSGTNIRDTPKGQIIGKLTYDEDCDCQTISFTEAQDGWLKLEEGGWVHGSLFEVATRNYAPGEKVYLMSDPTEESQVVKEFDIEKTFTIVGCCASWLQVKDSDGTVGWLTGEMVCANPLTNCS